jgi:hypothetical protein
MDFLAEYQEVTKIPPHIAVTYKFFSIFKFEDGELCYIHYKSGPMEPAALSALKAFLKAQRSDLRGDARLGKGECSRRMWFFYQKLLDLKLFDKPARMEIMRWMEICELVLF